MEEFDPKGTFGNIWRHFVVVCRGLMVWVTSGSETQAHSSSPPPNKKATLILKYQLVQEKHNLAQGLLAESHEFCFTGPHSRDP